CARDRPLVIGAPSVW
nr:immunoglobulin heavy chain junction region [Macaca mulatta]